MDSFQVLFSNFGIFDVVDIILVAILIYLFYSLLRGTIAVNILIGYLFVYLFYLLVKSLQMKLLTAFLNGFFQVGVIALVIVFQPEIRKFLLMIGKNFKLYRNQYWFKFFVRNEAQKEIRYSKLRPVLDACKSMQETRTGALIIFARSYEDENFYKNGEEMRAVISKRLLETIFSKNSPLHDGAVIIAENRVMAAGCILPLAENHELPLYMGLRHRAAVGISEVADVAALVVSEETGNIAYARQGKIKTNLDMSELEKNLRKDWI
ncbi:diadenylate cyclase CdaA [Solitalea koreensis]|uniref:Diadenylate cyclase n=1 Tax=Solitalea koreensis TaxID=543615 RepID=A0A521CJ54_9SPHI|nr:diadenylate cyclase CdaA [Solitalea koreensis]SMO59422.1 TIGR00159 family protein [Solitalea koreensis]